MPNAPMTLPGVPGNQNVQTMSSREIADLCETRHNQVVETIERLFEKGVLRESRKTTRPYAPDGGGRPTQVYDLTKRDTLVVASGYNDELRARIIDRWQELEEAAARNASVARRIPRTEISRECRLTQALHLKMAKMAGLSGNQALIAANRATAALTGIDSLGLMGITHMDAPQNEALLSPTDIGKRLGSVSARTVNLILTGLGLQTSGHDHKGRIYYEPTEEGVRAGGVMQDTGKQHSTGTPVRQLRWASSIVHMVEDAMRQNHAA